MPRVVILLIFAALLLPACAVRPTAVTPREMQAQRDADVAELRSAQPLPKGPITLHQAMARALLYNYEQKLALVQQAFALKQVDLANYAMLPHVVVDAGYSGRNNFNAASSQSLITGRQSLEVSTAEDRNRVVADLALSWNILDFAVGYHQAHQQADLALIAEEARRATIDSLTQQVRVAYWRAVAAERVRANVDGAIERVRAALQDSQLLEALGAGNRLTALTYQRTLLETLSQLQVQRRQIDQQRIQLASLMGLPPESDFSLAEENSSPAAERPPALPAVEDLEEYALVNRPEIRQEAYQRRISAADTRIALLKALPGLNLGAMWNRDSNHFLYSNAWIVSAAKLSVNLVSLASGPAAIKSARAAEEVGHTRRLAVSMAVMMQVRTAMLAYRDAWSSYQSAAELSGVDRRILAQTATLATARRAAQKDVIAAQLNDILSTLKRDLAFADVQSAVASVFLSIGADPLPGAIESADIDTLARALASNEAKWLSGEFQVPAQHVGG